MGSSAKKTSRKNVTKKGNKEVNMYARYLLKYHY